MRTEKKPKGNSLLSRSDVVRICKIPHVTIPPRIDGKLDDEAWKQAACLKEMLDITPYLEHRWNIAAGNPLSFKPEPRCRPAVPRTRVLVCHDGVYLYAGFICEDTKIENIRKRDHAFSCEVNQEDCVYIWLDPDLTHMAPHSFEYIVNAAGQKSENIKGKFSGGYDSLIAWEGWVSIDKKHWTAELMIPLDRLGLNLTDKNAFGLNLGRGFRGKFWTHAIFRPDGDFPAGWGFGVLLDSKKSPQNGIKKINDFFTDYEIRQSGQILATEPGGLGSWAAPWLHRDQNAMIGISVWGPDYQPTISVGRSDCVDRRWFGDEFPPVTRREVIAAAMSGDQKRLEELTRRPCAAHDHVYPSFPTPKPVGQIIVGLPGGVNANWATKVARGKDGAILLNSRSNEGKIKLGIYVHKRRNLVVIEGEQKGFNGKELTLRLYRHKDTLKKPEKHPSGYNYDADEKAGKYIGPLASPEVGIDENIMWLKQKFPAEQTFPDGFEVLMAGVAPELEAAGTEIRENEVGLGTPAMSSLEDWVSSVSGQNWGATYYRILNAAPGAAATLRVRLEGNKFRALFAVVSTNDGADILAVAKKLLREADTLSDEKLESDSLGATRAERIGNYNFKQDLAFFSVFSAKFCYQDLLPWKGSFTFNEIGGIFYDCFIEGRTDELETFFQMVETILPAARALAKEAFECRGAAIGGYFYPIRRRILPGMWDFYALENTGLVFQPFWLAYLYTMDRDFLEQRAYPAIKEAALFYADYVTLEDDGLYHVCPSTSDEHFHLQPYLKYNKDSNSALTMVKFILNAAVQGALTLKVDVDLAKSWQRILDKLAPYPTEETSEGPRFLDVAGARLMTEYNIFAPLFAVFYGNDIGLASPEEEIKKAKRTLVGINRISTPQHWPHVYRSMIRLGIYHGGKIGCENLIQSHQGPIFLFPAVPERYTGGFNNYHAAGGFVVSSSMESGKIKTMNIRSLSGMKCTVCLGKFDKAPVVRCVEDRKNIESSVESGRYLSFKTVAGKTYDFLR